MCTQNIKYRKDITQNDNNVVKTQKGSETATALTLKAAYLYQTPSPPCAPQNSPHGTTDPGGHTS